MNHNLDHFLVVSDVDNTLLDPHEGMPSCNLTMIKLFCELGGKFTIASGRTFESVEQLTKQVPLSAPAILYGGGLLFDFAEGRPVVNHTMDRLSARLAVRDVLAKFPRVGIEIMSDNGRIYAINPNEQVCTHAREESISYVVCSLDEVPGNWYKVLFADDPASLALVREYTKDRHYENIYFLQTNAYYYEIMPQHINKGIALQELAARLQIPMENVYAIGDYHNDIDLLRAAGHAVAVGNAVPEVKMISNQVVLPCKDGGVAQLLYQLIKQYS